MDLKPILKFLINNPIRKTLAIIFAFGLWFYVALDNEYQYIKNIKVDYTHLAETLIIVDSVPRIKVKFTGRGGPLLTTWAAVPKALCNLRQVEIGKNTIPVEELVITTGFSDIKINHTTKAINVTVDEKVCETLKVTVPTKGTIKQGYAISDIIVLDTLYITGPREMLRGLTKIATETLSVNNVKTSFVRVLKLTSTSPLLTFSTHNVSAEIIIDTAVEKQFTDIPLKLIFTPEQRVSSDKVSLDTLIVSGPKTKVDRLMKKDIIVKISLTQKQPGEYNFPASITLPEFITPIYSHPKRFKVKIH